MTSDLAAANETGGSEDDVEERLSALLAPLGGLVDWRSLRSTDAAKTWATLRVWVEWFRVEFVLDHRVVPPCWFRHSALVSLLSALHDHWRAAYDPLNSLLGPSDWHRALIPLEQRLREWASRSGCTARIHRPDLVADHPAGESGWTAHVAADIAARRAREATDGDDA